MSQNAIHTSDLTRHFQTVQAVNHLSIDVPAGIVFGYLGPNGSGKTTTIRLLLGLQANDGRATVLGYSTLHNLIRSKDCGALLEHHGL
jgi:ABC-2 type transport system ATP-binding protein